MATYDPAAGSSIQSSVSIACVISKNEEEAGKNLNGLSYTIRYKISSKRIPPWARESGARDSTFSVYRRKERWGFLPPTKRNLIALLSVSSKYNTSMSTVCP